MRRFLSILLTAGAVLVAFASMASPAGAATGGVEAVQAGSTDSGGARYATLPPEPKSKPVKKKRKVTKKRRAGKRKKARRPVPKPRPVAPLPSADHIFPVQGAFSLGGKDGRFGAGRPGHTHQGQDISAALGTPVVAPWAGIVEAVKYQASGAGYYVVLDGAGEDRDYVFMHLRKGSTLVTRGQSVAKGQQLAQVGSTGASSGPHLHFEIWIDGGWYTGGQPTDPLPFLNAWL